jgi:hypothetical protein
MTTNDNIPFAIRPLNVSYQSLDRREGRFNQSRVRTHKLKTAEYRHSGPWCKPQRMAA